MLQDIQAGKQDTQAFQEVIFISILEDSHPKGELTEQRLACFFSGPAS
jgi:hypothetical protein